MHLITRTAGTGLPFCRPVGACRTWESNKRVVFCFPRSQPGGHSIWSLRQTLMFKAHMEHCHQADIQGSLASLGSWGQELTQQGSGSWGASPEMTFQEAVKEVRPAGDCFQAAVAAAVAGPSLSLEESFLYTESWLEDTSLMGPSLQPPATAHSCPREAPTWVSPPVSTARWNAVADSLRK